MPSSVDNEGANINRHRALRVRCYPVSPEILPHMFRTGEVIEITSGIPDGAQFRGHGHDACRNLITIFVEHESFDIVPEGQAPPEFQLQMKRHK